MEQNNTRTDYLPQEDTILKTAEALKSFWKKAGNLVEKANRSLGLFGTNPSRNQAHYNRANRQGIKDAIAILCGLQDGLGNGSNYLEEGIGPTKRRLIQARLYLYSQLINDYSRELMDEIADQHRYKVINTYKIDVYKT